MPTHSLNNISDLAESIAEENIFKNKVNLEKIAKKKKISLIYGNYDDCFLGELMHSSNKFYIYLNLHLLSSKFSTRTRFTLGHELGHYFIDAHRNKLKNGESLSYSSDYNYVSNIPVEKEANHFSSHLLMPKTRFIKLAGKQEPGVPSILSLKDTFHTSFEGTSIHYINLNLLPCMFIKWRADLTHHYASYTNSFAKLTGLKGKPGIKVHPEYIKEIFHLLETEAPRPDYVECATKLSSWLPNILPDSRMDLIGLEQTIKLGTFGGITFLCFPQ
ncbi:MAG: ImmA/IrrE family metallo-endopeptidase [Bacteroidota bacterium]